MELLTGTAIRDFKIRGNYCNHRSLLSRIDLRSSKDEKTVPNRPGYSAPVVEFELDGRIQGSLVVRELDIPLLCQDDLEKAKNHLSLILNADRGDAKAIQELSSVAENHPWNLDSGTGKPQPAESTFVVPSTSCETHSEGDISQKGFILLKLTQLGYPVPDFVVLTSQAYADRAQHLEDRLSDALQQLEFLTMQSAGNARDPLVFAIRCATAYYIPGVMDTYLNVGVTERTLPCLEKTYGPIVARKMFLNTLRNLCNNFEGEDYAAIISAVKSDLPADEVVRLIEQLSAIVRKTDKRLIEDSFFQAAFFVKQAYKHFENNQDLLITLCRGKENYPALILQKMVYGPARGCLRRRDFQPPHPDGIGNGTADRPQYLRRRNDDRDGRDPDDGFRGKRGH
jgi:hypothetical protein